MPSKAYLILRSAQRARLEGRTTRVPRRSPCRGAAVFVTRADGCAVPGIAERLGFARRQAGHGEPGARLGRSHRVCLQRKEAVDPPSLGLAAAASLACLARRGEGGGAVLDAALAQSGDRL